MTSFNPHVNSMLILFETHVIWNFNIVIDSIKTISTIHIPKTILRQRRSIHRSIISIPTFIISISTFIIGVAIERVIGHQTLL